MKMITLNHVLIVSTVALLSVSSFSRNAVWHDSVTLWSDAAGKSPQKGKVHYNLGASLALRERYDPAEVHFKKALALAPDHKTHSNLGSIYFLQGRMTEAERHFELAIHYNPSSPDVRYNLGLLCLEQARLDEAKHHFHVAVLLDPAFVEALNSLALVAVLQGRFADAERHKEQTKASEPESEQ
ncbi:MAG: hypothetical protein A2010_00115 [Nitrospirae bacterium GWD2_57_9]|nr:MAG: hypothetical protein A2010_00115 [Nitrospirae bacterium GWD2_57_9]